MRFYIHCGDFICFVYLYTVIIWDVNISSSRITTLHEIKSNRLANMNLMLGTAFVSIY